MVAMLSALMSLPLTAAYAFAVSGKSMTAMAVDHGMHKQASADEMPCHKPAKPCPHCPQNVCPYMGSCLLKCFQLLPMPVGEARLDRDLNGERVKPALVRMTLGSPVPPLLRPPIV
jgi:hypothetical protein